MSVENPIIQRVWGGVVVVGVSISRIVLEGCWGFLYLKTNFQISKCSNFKVSHLGKVMFSNLNSQSSFPNVAFPDYKLPGSEFPIFKLFFNSPIVIFEFVNLHMSIIFKIDISKKFGTQTF